MSLTDDVIRYYAARAPWYDETAGYLDPEAEVLREPIKERYRELFKGHRVLEIACGTGYWTAVVGEAARSVLAVDANPVMVSLARERCRHMPNVEICIADAYTLEGIPSRFTAASGIWWWSHIPKARLRPFLETLHQRLKPGALVLFSDLLPYEGWVRRVDDEGNTLEQRPLPDGRTFEIVKNFPTEDEIRTILVGFAEKGAYTESPEERNWTLTYTTAVRACEHASRRNRLRYRYRA